MKTQDKKNQRARRQKRIRAKVIGSIEKPRISVFKSNKYISAQLIDDKNGITLASATTKGMKGAGTKDKAFAMGKSLAEQAKSKKIDKAVFDRGGYLYTGSVASVAEGAREGGLKF